MTEAKKMLTKKKKKPGKISIRDYLHSGSTLLNLACSGKTQGAFIKGKYYFMVGDSSSGKTFLSLTCFAEAANNPNFENYRLIYDNSEDGALMDFEKYFGKKMAAKIESPAVDSDGPIFSQSIEEFYYHVDDAIKAGQPFIYVMDSMDSLTSEDEAAKFEQQKKAHRSKKEAPGSYGDGKAKKNSANLRRILGHLKRTGSILIIINQTRDNITGMGFDKKTRSGGHALKFYATLEIWLSVKEKLTKTINKKQRQLGIICRAKVKKNRITGKDRYVDIPLYHSIGIDDTGGCIKYLLAEEHWKKGNGGINAKEFEVTMKEEELVAHIEENGLEKDLHEIVADVWNDIEEKTVVVRKKRYE